MDNISSRVQNKIVQYEGNSEQIIAFFQLGFVLLLGTLYFLSPKNIDAPLTIFSSVPIFLALWSIFIAVRITLDYLNLLKGAMIYILIVIDMVLLVGLIWAYHLQYQSPPGLSLKAPTFIFLPIFIALRALRFQVRYIVVSTISAVFCWTLLVIYAVQNGPTTNSFIDYTLSHSVLIGAEVEKMIAILCCGAVLAFAAYRSRKLLVFSQRRQEAIQNLSSFFSPEIREQIAFKGDEFRPGIGKRRHGAIVVVDIRGFSSYSAQNDPDVVMTNLSSYQSQLVPVFIKNGGCIDKFMGDGILVHFGVVDESKSYVANALRSVESITDAMNQWNQKRIARNEEPFQVSIGIAEGRVMFGTVGDAERLEFTVIGNPVNAAVKLEKATRKYPASIICTGNVYKLAIKQGYKSTLSPYKVKNQKISGLETMLDLVLLLTPQEKEVLKTKK